MSHAAFLSGVALANSGLGLAHGVAAALGVHQRVPHGLACAVMLPITLRANRPVCVATSRHWPVPPCRMRRQMTPQPLTH